MDWIELKLKRVSAVAVAALALSACSVMGPRESPLPKEGPTMKEIYDGHQGRAATTPAQGAADVRDTRPAPPPDRLSSAYIERIEARFTRAPNPDLVMYVYPHLATGKYPVPGYYTAFPMYETVHYLLPGEAAAWRGAAK